MQKEYVYGFNPNYNKNNNNTNTNTNTNQIPNNNTHTFPLFSNSSFTPYTGFYKERIIYTPINKEDSTNLYNNNNNNSNNNNNKYNINSSFNTPTPNFLSNSTNPFNPSNHRTPFQTKYVSNFLVQIKNDFNFNVTKRIIGEGGHIVKGIVMTCKNYITGRLKLRLRGEGSGFIEPFSLQESTDPLQICISSILIKKPLKNAVLKQRIY